MKGPYVLFYEGIQWESHRYILPAIATVLQSIGVSIIRFRSEEDVFKRADELVNSATAIIALPPLSYSLPVLARLRRERGIRAPAIILVASDLVVGASNIVECRKQLSAQDIFVGLSEPEVSLIRSAFPKNRVEKVGYPILDSFLGGQSWRRRLATRESRNILYAGRLTPQKNILGLIEAFARVNKKVDCVLTMVGSFRDEFDPCFGNSAGDKFERRVRSKVRELGLDGQIEFLGIQPREKVRDLMLNADVNVSLSLYRREEFGYCVAEGLSLGVPSVVTEWGGGIDFVKGNAAKGVRVGLTSGRPTTDPDTAANAIIDVMNDQLAWSEAATSYALENLRQKSVAKHWQKMLGSISQNRIEERETSLELLPILAEFYLESLTSHGVKNEPAQSKPVFAKPTHPYNQWVLANYSGNPR